MPGHTPKKNFRVWYDTEDGEGEMRYTPPISLPYVSFQFVGEEQTMFIVESTAKVLRYNPARHIP